MIIREMGKDEEYLSARSAAVETGMQIDYVYRLLWMRRLEGKMIGGRWWIRRCSLRAYMKKRAERAAAQEAKGAEEIPA